jgi:hypothetical protein
MKPLFAWCGPCDQTVALAPNVVWVRGRLAVFEYPCCGVRASMEVSKRVALVLAGLLDSFVEEEVGLLRDVLDRPDAVEVLTRG